MTKVMKIVIRQVPEPPPPVGEIHPDLWVILSKWGLHVSLTDYAPDPFYLEGSDINFLEGISYGTKDPAVRDSAISLIYKIKKYGQVQVEPVWVEPDEDANS